MRIISVCLLWVLGAVAAAALCIALWQGFVFVQAGQSTSALPELLLFALADHTTILVYAAIVGLVFALISLIPRNIRARTEQLFGWALFGAVSGALSIAFAVFIYKGVMLYLDGVAADAFPIAELLLEEMRIVSFLPYGAIAGAALAVVLVILAGIKEGEARDAAQALAAVAQADPDTLIRAQRAQRAQQYLNERGQSSMATSR